MALTSTAAAVSFLSQIIRPPLHGCFVGLITYRYVSRNPYYMILWGSFMIETSSLLACDTSTGDLQWRAIETGTYQSNMPTLPLANLIVNDGSGDTVKNIRQYCAGCAE